MSGNVAEIVIGDIGSYEGDIVSRTMGGSYADDWNRDLRINRMQYNVPNGSTVGFRCMVRPPDRRDYRAPRHAAP
jgi:hypothetical protein